MIISRILLIYMELDRRNLLLKKTIIFFVLGICFIEIVHRLYIVQIRDKDVYVEMSKKQYVGESLALKRGKIYFTSKDDKVTAAEVEEYEKLNSKNEIITDTRRNYPYGEIASKVLGFVAYKDDERVGQYGIEKYYNDVLSREKDKFWVNLFAEIFASEDFDLDKFEEGNSEGDIKLTIDIEVQKYIYKILSETMTQWSSENIGAIVINPKDGRIIAMEELPTFDPNLYNKVSDPSLFKNDMVSGVYEVGSIIKPLTVAAAMDSGVIDLDSFYNDVGSRELNGRKVSNYDGRARGWVSVQEILSQSLNIGIVYLIEKIGQDKFTNYFKSFGLGEETGIDLPSESSGLTSNLDSDIFVDAATAGFGQGMAISPIQTVRALSIVANGGKLINPYVVDSITSTNGEDRKIVPDEPAQILSSDASLKTTKMLVRVVDEALAKGKYKSDKYSIAAKTGTAQIPEPGGGYYKDRYLHSFFAYFPAYDPQFLIFLYQKHPIGAEYASQTLTEPSFKIIDFLSDYYGVEPDRGQKVQP